MLKKEKEFYEPIKTVLQRVFGNYIEERPYQTAPFSHKENPYLEITAKRHYSEMLKGEFDNRALRILGVERSAPDIMGFVQRKPSSKKELITVEVKSKAIRLLDILQARFYQDIFKATFGLLISPKGIIEEKVRFVLDTNIGRSIRGKVIIAKFDEQSYGYGRETFWTLKINPRFEKSIPEPFKRFCKP